MIGLDATAVKSNLAYLLSAASNDPTRTNIGQIHVNGPESVTTDGHRLHIVKNATFPLASVSVAAARLLLDVLRATEATLLELSGQEFRCLGGLVPATLSVTDTVPAYRFPEYRQVIPNWTEKAWHKASVLKAAASFKSADGSKEWKLNGKYVEDALRGAGKQPITVYLPDDEMSPVGFEFGNRFAIIVPFRK